MIKCISTKGAQMEKIHVEGDNAKIKQFHLSEYSFICTITF